MKVDSAIVTALPPLIKWGKGLFFGGKNGRTFDFFGSSCNKCRFQCFVGYAARLLPTRSLVLVCAVWISLSPLVLRAEWDSGDSVTLGQLLLRVEDISDTQATNNGQNELKRQIGYATLSGLPLRNSSISMDLGQIISQDSARNLVLTNVVARLDSIIAALEDLKSSDDSGGSGDGTGITINETWLTEDTFKSDFGGFVDKYDTFLSSWGFEGGSGGSFKSFLNPSSITLYNLNTSWSLGTPEPFPGSFNETGVLWPDFYLSSYTSNTNFDNFPSFFSRILYENTISLLSGQKRFMIKQSWNDWQAHTNLISRLDHIFNLDDKSDLSFNEETGQLTLKEETGGSGSGNVVTDLRPVSTNSVDTAVQSVTNSTSRIAGIYDKEEIENRYLNDELLLVGSNYGIGEQQGSIAAGNLVTPWFTIDFNVWGHSYRNALTIDRLNSWRTVAGYIWTLASIVLCVILVRRWGNM